jgi:hypothetical protein
MPRCFCARRGGSDAISMISGKTFRALGPPATATHTWARPAHPFAGRIQPPRGSTTGAFSQGRGQHDQAPFQIGNVTRSSEVDVTSDAPLPFWLFEAVALGKKCAGSGDFKTVSVASGCSEAPPLDAHCVSTTGGTPTIPDSLASGPTPSALPASAFRRFIKRIIDMIAISAIKKMIAPSIINSVIRASFFSVCSRSSAEFSSAASALNLSTSALAS